MRALVLTALLALAPMSACGGASSGPKECTAKTPCTWYCDGKSAISEDLHQKSNQKANEHLCSKAELDKLGLEAELRAPSQR